MPTRLFDWIRRYQLTLFFFLTLVTSWAIWIPAAVAKLQGTTSVFAPEGFIGGMARWTPGLMAILLSLLIARKSGIGKLFRPILIWRVNIFWYIFALFFQIVVFYAGKMIDALFGNYYKVASPLISVYGAQAAFMLPFVILFAFPGVFAEELGWRGFALRRLQSKASALLGSIILAIFWGIWHIPLLIYFGQLRTNDILGAVLSLLEFIPLTILYTWLYNNTKGSLLLVSVFHIGQQLANNLLGTWPTYTDNILVWITAIMIVLIAGPMDFSRNSIRNLCA